MLPLAVPVNVKEPAAPVGFVTFLTTMAPRWVFVKVQTTVAPAVREMLLGELPLSQVELVRSQPAVAASDTLYTPGRISPLSCDWPSVSEKLSPPTAQLPVKLNDWVLPGGRVTFLTIMCARRVFVNAH